VAPPIKRQPSAKRGSSPMNPDRCRAYGQCRFAQRTTP
jgi:hypothetical protein